MHVENELVLFHTMYFHLIRLINQKDIDNYISGNYHLLPRDVIEKFTKLGILSEEDNDINTLNRLLKILNKIKVKPVIYIYLTNKCNQSCYFCYQLKDRIENFNPTITINDIDKIFDYTIENLNINEGEFVLFGGEPLLKENYEIVNYFFNKLSLDNRFQNFNVQIITNGITLDTYDSIIEKNKNKISFVRITLNGDRNLHNIIKPNTYDLITKNIKNFALKYKNIEVLINYLMDNNTLNNFKTFLFEQKNLLSLENVQLTVGRIQDRQVIKENKNNIFVEDYFCKLYCYYKNNNIPFKYLEGGELDILNKIFLSKIGYNDRVVLPNIKGCTAVNIGKHTFHSNGNVLRCCDCFSNEYSIGNYRKNEYNQQKVKLWTDYELTIRDKCCNCKFYGICNGACPARNINITGNIDNIICYNIEQAVSNWIKLLYEYEGGIFYAI